MRILLSSRLTNTASVPSRKPISSILLLFSIGSNLFVRMHRNSADEKNVKLSNRPITTVRRKHQKARRHGHAD